jgi:hypothetical protein
MLDNYIKLSDGRIKQEIIKPFEYGLDYSEAYNQSPYKENSEYISYLRYAYIIGSIGKIPNSVLDVGYGNGGFLSVASNQILNCFGFDISEYPVPSKCMKVDSMTDQFYDVITFFDSLEHFEDISFVKDLKCEYVCISLPWCHNFSDEWFDRWKHRKPDEHLWHFNKEALISFMFDNGYLFINSCNIEDQIRKSSFNYPNILTAMFKKI